MSLDLRYEDVLPCSNLYLQPDERLTLAISPGSGVLEMPVLPVSISTTKLRKILSRYWTKLLWIILATYMIQGDPWNLLELWLLLYLLWRVLSSKVVKLCYWRPHSRLLLWSRHCDLSKLWNWEWCFYEMNGETFSELCRTSSETPSFLPSLGYFSFLARVCSTKSNVFFTQCLLNKR